jgi:hypothetical protein
MGCMPSTWRKVTYLAVGGLTEVGFADGRLLLVVSHQGRGVVDLASGEPIQINLQVQGQTRLAVTVLRHSLPLDVREGHEQAADATRRGHAD